MIITVKEIIDNQNILGHLVLQSISSFPQILHEIQKNQSAEIILTVNGVSVPIKPFIDHWQSQIDKIVKEHAERLIEEKFRNLGYLIDDFEAKVKESLDL